MSATFKRTSTVVAAKSRKHSQAVWVVVRHTRAGDHRLAVIDNSGPASREIAMARAEEAANRAACDYGHGAASVFKGKLTWAARAEL